MIIHCSQYLIVSHTINLSALRIQSILLPCHPKKSSAQKVKKQSVAQDVYWRCTKEVAKMQVKGKKGKMIETRREEAIQFQIIKLNLF